jgi:hypothetical protein
MEGCMLVTVAVSRDRHNVDRLLRHGEELAKDKSCLGSRKGTGSCAGPEHVPHWCGRPTVSVSGKTLQKCSKFAQTSHIVLP